MNALGAGQWTPGRMLALAFLLGFQAPMLMAATAGAQSVPPAVMEILPQVKEAEEQYAQISLLLQSHQKETAPLVASVMELKEKIGQRDVWWRRWWLNRRLGALQEALEQVRQDEKRWRAAREILFQLYSGIDEEFSSSLEKSLAAFQRPGGADSTKAKRLVFLADQKEIWMAKLNTLGFSEDKPFRLAQLPELEARASSGEQLKDRLAVLKARSIQLEGWADIVQRDLHLYQGLRKIEGLGKGGLNKKIQDLQATSRGVEMRMRINQEDLVKCQALLSPPKRHTEPYLSNY